MTKDALANTFLGWRAHCGSALRASYEKLNDNPTVTTEEQLSQVIPLMLQGKWTPQQAGDQVQAALDTWYKPSK